MRRPRRSLRVVEVAGPSMVPTLRNGDLVVAVTGAAARPGDVVLARFVSIPERLVVKRAARPVPGGWWVESDNRFAGGDSSAHGAAVVEARVLLRIRRGRPRRILSRPAGVEQVDPD